MEELRYLIVDDSPTVRLTVKQGLLQEKVPADHIVEVGSAADALTAFDRVHPQVVFLDVSLGEAARPGAEFDILSRPRAGPKSGNEVARHFRTRDPSVTIVVCTGNSTDDPRVRELIQGGAFQVLQKPVRLPQIREVLHQIREERGDGAAPSP